MVWDSTQPNTWCHRRALVSVPTHRKQEAEARQAPALTHEIFSSETQMKILITTAMLMEVTNLFCKTASRAPCPVLDLPITGEMSIHWSLEKGHQERVGQEDMNMWCQRG